MSSSLALAGSVLLDTIHMYYAYSPGIQLNYIVVNNIGVPIMTRDKKPSKATRGKELKLLQPLLVQANKENSCPTWSTPNEYRRGVVMLLLTRVARGEIEGISLPAINSNIYIGIESGQVVAWGTKEHVFYLDERPGTSDPEHALNIGGEGNIRLGDKGDSPLGKYWIVHNLNFHVVKNCNNDETKCDLA